MPVPGNYIGLKKVYDDLDCEVQNYLGKLEPLLTNGKNYEIALAYCFMKLEEGHHRALKCGLVRIHRCDSAKVDAELEKQHFTKEKYAEIFKNVFSANIPQKAASHLKRTQGIRNKIIHGKSTTDSERREAIFFAVEYMKCLGDFVKKKTQKNPYGNLTGLRGSMDLLPAKSTIWMLKGFGVGDN